MTKAISILAGMRGGKKKKEVGVGVHEFDSSKYRCDIPTPLRPELKIKCACIIRTVVPARVRNDQTRLHDSHVRGRGERFSRQQLHKQYQTRTAALPRTATPSRNKPRKP